MEVDVMANIKKAPDDQKNEKVTIRLTGREREEIKKVASENGMKISEYILAKSMQKGTLSVRKESKRIIELAHTEDAFGVVKAMLRANRPHEDILEACKEVDKEIIKLWRC